MRLELDNTNPQVMLSLLHHVLDRSDRFARWFDAHFGWFFTNGMKERRPPDGSGVKA